MKRLAQRAVELGKDEAIALAAGGRAHCKKILIINLHYVSAPLATEPPIDLYTDNQIVDLKPAQKHGTKVIHIRGSADPAIRWRHDVDYYNRGNHVVWRHHRKGLCEVAVLVSYVCRPR